MKEIFDDLLNTIWTDDRLLALRTFAAEEGFKINDRERFGRQANGLKGFQLFKGKRGKRLKGVLYKIDHKSSLKTRIYDYVYFGGSKNRISTVIEFYLPQWVFSEMLIQPKRRIHRLRDFFRKQPLLFKDIVHFHEKYQIYSPKPENLKYELNEDFLDLLADQDKIWVEAREHYILFYSKKRMLPIEKLAEIYDYILDLLDSLLNGQSSEEYV